LEKLVKDLEKRRYVSIDTESDSLYSYYYKLCLVQIESEGLTAIIDPFQTDMSIFLPILKSPDIEKIFHSAQSDIKVIKLAFKAEVRNIFDIMLAAKYLGIKRCGLDNLVRKYFGVNLNKKFQKANWGKRPLEIELLNYAILDVIYLKKLRDAFIKELKTRHLLDELKEEFDFIADMEPVKAEFNSNGWLKIMKTKNLNFESAKVLKHLYLERERMAKSMNIPPFKVISEEVMATLARNAHEALKNICQYKGITPYVYKKHGEWIKRTIEKGLADKCFTISYKAISPEKKAHFEKVKRRQKKLREWRREAAKKRGMLSEVIISGELLDKIAYANPKTLSELECINGFLKSKLTLYGEEILDCLKMCAASSEFPSNKMVEPPEV